jgi:MerR family mercuric resistance operon transcriptional regulator
MVRSQAPATSWTIAGLARAGGVGVETVRYYQRRGLLPTPDGAAGVRRYGAADLRQLRFVKAAQAAGFTLAQIGELLAMDPTADRARARALADARLADIDRTIASLQSVRASLGRLARDCRAGGRGPCPILDAFDHDPPAAAAAA